MSLSLQKGLQGLPQKIRSNALAESSTPQPTDFGVAVPLKYKSRKYSFMRNVPFHKLSKVYKYLKTADLQAHNASRRDTLCACRSAIFKWSKSI